MKLGLGLALAVLAAVARPSAGALDLHWYDAIQKAGTLCNGNLCRAFVHLVFVATPGDVVNALNGTGTFALDGGDVEDPTSCMFERHLVEGACTGSDCVEYGDSQMWNWGFDRTYTLEEDLPSSLCVTVTMNDPDAGDTATLDEVCVSFGSAQTVTGNTDGSVQVSFDDSGFTNAATRVCSDATGECRTNLHVVYSAANADVVQIMDTGGSYTLDGGNTWRSDGFATYEQHIDQDGSTWYQAMQFDVDVFDSASATQACFNVWVNDTTTATFAWVTEHTCLDICTTLADFHDPDGYCGDGRR